MSERKHRHLFPIIDEMVTVAMEEIEKDGEDKVTCQMGCDHCCHLLIEASWEEAVELAHAIAAKPSDERRAVVGRVRENAKEAKRFFLSSRGGTPFVRPVRGEKKMKDHLYDDYFYKKKRPCPFLENASCTAYESRPTPCRLHFVVSDPVLCRYDVKDDSEYDVPDRAEELKEEVGPVISAMEKDGRWGHLGIIVETALDELTRKGILDIPEYSEAVGEQDTSESGSSDEETRVSEKAA